MSITLDVARAIAEACKQRARELRSPVSIAIVDAGGHLVLFERMMSPYGWATGDISIAKATTAVMFNQSTDAVSQWGVGIPGFASSMATMTDGRFIMAAGGWPIRSRGATIGGIGVSGGNAAGRDDEIARAGLGTLEALAAPVPAQPMPMPPQPMPTPQPQFNPVYQAPFASQVQSAPQYQPPVAPQPVGGNAQQEQNQPVYQPPVAPQPVGGNAQQEQNQSAAQPQGTSYLDPVSGSPDAPYSESAPNNNETASYDPFNEHRSGGQP